jgi:hypothetical protein
MFDTADCLSPTGAFEHSMLPRMYGLRRMERTGAEGRCLELFTWYLRSFCNSWKSPLTVASVKLSGRIGPAKHTWISKLFRGLRDDQGRRGPNLQPSGEKMDCTDSRQMATCGAGSPTMSGTSDTYESRTADQGWKVSYPVAHFPLQ